MKQEGSYFTLSTGTEIYANQGILLGVDRDRARLGIQADSRFTVLRDELLKQ